MNDDEFADFARLTAEQPWHVRFIELMPVGTNAAASEHFCNACNRIRVTARGALCACLFGERGTDVRGALYEGVSESALQDLLARAIDDKPERHPFGDDFAIDAGAMSEIGG